MLTLIDIPDYLETAYHKSKEVSALLVDEMKSFEKEMVIEKDVDLFKFQEEGFYYIHDGLFRLYHGNLVVRFFYTGDLFHVGKIDEINKTKLISNFGTKVSFYPKNLMLGKIQRDEKIFKLWNEYQELEIYIRDVLCSLYMNYELKPELTMKHFKFNDVMINEGENPEGIFVLVDGEARVTVKGFEVGNVSAGEIFGEISFLTGKKRIATVTAKTNCLVQYINKENFVLLIKYRPQFFLKISKTLAERVINLNDKLVENHV